MSTTTASRRLTASLASLALVAALGIAGGAPAASAPVIETWFGLDTQLDGGITATVTTDDGLMYAGGWFTEAGGEPAEGVATYDGTSWSPLPSGPGFEIDSFATDGTNVYAGGAWYDFGDGDSSLGGVAMWDGTDWTDLTGDLPDGTWISALAIARGDLYAFGFTYLDPDNPSTRVCLAAEFTGTNDAPVWTSIGDVTSSDCMINDATVVDAPDDDIYVVGDFADVNGDPYNGVARYITLDGTWEPLADGLDFGDGAGSPYAVSQGPGGDADWSIVVAGQFWLAPEDGGDDVAFAEWDGTAWTPMLGFDGFDGITGTSLALDDGTLYLGGYFETIDETVFNGIARWDGTAFSPLGDGVRYSDDSYAEADTIAPYGDSVIVSGDFEKAGSVATLEVARYGPAQVPGAPRTVTGTAGKGSVAVKWWAPAFNGGVPVTRYTVTASPGGRTCSVAAPTKTCTVTGLSSSTSYRFTVRATNAVGTGPASAASAAIRPLASTSKTVSLSTRVLFFAYDTRVGPTGSAALAELKSKIPARAKVTSVRITGYVQGTTSRYVTADDTLALARAKAAATWLKNHGVGGTYTLRSGGVGGTSGYWRAAVVVLTYTVPA